jgi:hypothetical protein
MLAMLAVVAACSAGAPRAELAHRRSLASEVPPAPSPEPDPAPEPLTSATIALVGAPLDAPVAALGPERAADLRPRMGAIDFQAWIYKRPEAKGLPLGYIRLGTSVPLRSGERVAGEGCPRGWYAVAPRGYACLSFKTTLDLEDPYFKALGAVSPDPAAVWAYSYAFSNGAPMYSRIPTPEEQDRAERKYGSRGSYVQLGQWSAGHEELIVLDPIEATDPVPSIFAGGGRTVGGGPRDPRRLVWREIPNGSMVAYAKAFAAEGRVWLLTPDLMLVPADRVRKLERSTFHGVTLGEGVELPLAWNRTKAPVPVYAIAAGGAPEPTGETIDRKAWVMVLDEPLVLQGQRFYPLRRAPSTFVRESDVTLSLARTTLPRSVQPDSKWIEAKILPGTLTAYEGLRPVRASLFSPGKGGVPAPGKDHAKYATTALGAFPIEWKDRVATMTSENGEPKLNWFTDVPNIQYLRAPLAMHVAYWHEDFGNPKSAECVNVSPEDGSWLFSWTDPPLPEGWGGVRPGDGNGLSTPVVITAR